MRTKCGSPEGSKRPSTISTWTCSSDASSDSYPDKVGVRRMRRPPGGDIRVGDAVRVERGQQGEALLPHLFKDSRLFRLIVDEVEKTLLLVDLDIARDYASLVPNEGVRDIIFAMIEQELALTREMVLKVSGGTEIAERFPEYRRALAQRLPTINEVNREQVELLRRFRGAESEAERDAFKSALLLSINTVAAGLGATG